MSQSVAQYARWFCNCSQHYGVTETKGEFTIHIKQICHPTLYSSQQYGEAVVLNLRHTLMHVKLVQILIYVPLKQGTVFLRDTLYASTVHATSVPFVCLSVGCLTYWWIASKQLDTSPKFFTTRWPRDSCFLVPNTMAKLWQDHPWCGTK